jgi:rubrerythrin
MSEKTEKNLALSLAAASRAAARHSAFAQKADNENNPAAAGLFRAQAESKSVQARRYLLLLRGKIGGTRENLESALALERRAFEVDYPEMIREADEEEMNTAQMVFSQTREVSSVQAALMEKALTGGPNPSGGGLLRLPGLRLYQRKKSPGKMSGLRGHPREIQDGRLIRGRNPVFRIAFTGWQRLFLHKGAVGAQMRRGADKQGA